MEELENGKIKIKNDKGEELICDVLFTFDSDDYGKSYVFVYPAGASEGEEVELEVYSFIETETGEQGELKPIETEEEWDMIEEVLNTFLADEEE